MRTLTASAVAALESGAYFMVRLFKFEFGAVHAFWDGDSDFVPSGTGVAAAAAGVRFRAGGSLIGMEREDVGTDGATPRLTLTLRSVKNSRLSPDVLGTFFAQAYHRKVVTCFLGLIDPTDRSIIQIIQTDRGYAQAARIVESWRDGRVESVLELPVETAPIDLRRLNLSDRNDEAQKDTLPGDRFFENLDEASQIKKWAEGVTGS